MQTESSRWWKQSDNTTILVGMQCTQCNKKFFPKRNICPDCNSKTTNLFDLPAVGHLVTWTITRVIPEEHDEDEMVIGLADFGGAIVLAKIHGAVHEELQKDLRLEVKLSPLRSDPNEGEHSFHFVVSNVKNKL